MKQFVVVVEDDQCDLAIAQHGQLVRLLHQAELALRECHLKQLNYGMAMNAFAVLSTTPSLPEPKRQGLNGVNKMICAVFHDCQLDAPALVITQRKAQPTWRLRSS